MSLRVLVARCTIANAQTPLLRTSLQRPTPQPARLRFAPLTSRMASSSPSVSAASGPRVVLGTMTFGGQTAPEDAHEMLRAFAASPLAHTRAEVDTARMYQTGRTEEIIGTILTQDAELRAKVAIATKANPFSGVNFSTAGINKQVGECLAALQTASVDVFYLHAPDATVDIKETLQAVQDLYTEGRFARFALSNYTAWETVWIHSYMASKGWVLPTIYQGMYNPITRTVEDELFPALRRLGMAFYAYNPLAGGFLTGKHKPDDLESRKGGRFSDETFWGQTYQKRFMQELHFKGLEVVRAACEAEGIPLAEAALRWMRHHSQLTERDAIIIGASSLRHFESNLASLAAGPLPQSVVDAYLKAWEICKPAVASYSRGYSGSGVPRIV